MDCFQVVNESEPLPYTALSFFPKPPDQARTAEPRRQSRRRPVAPTIGVPRMYPEEAQRGPKKSEVWNVARRNSHLKQRGSGPQKIGRRWSLGRTVGEHGGGLGKYRDWTEGLV